MHVEVLGKIEDVEVIAVGKAMRELPRLRKCYGKGRWKKMKGVATARLPHGRIGRVEIRWYEAHGIGRMEMKLKRYMD